MVLIHQIMLVRMILRMAVNREPLIHPTGGAEALQARLIPRETTDPRTDTIHSVTHGLLQSMSRHAFRKEAAAETMTEVEAGAGGAIQTQTDGHLRHRCLIAAVPLVITCVSMR